MSAMKRTLALELIRHPVDADALRAMLPTAQMSEAEEAGLVWADAQGVQVLYVGYGTLDHPIALTAVDEPL